MLMNPICVCCIICGFKYKCLCVCVLRSLMQRRYSEPNTYIDSLPAIPHSLEDLYDDVASIEADPEVSSALQRVCLY